MKRGFLNNAKVKKEPLYPVPSPQAPVSEAKLPNFSTSNTAGAFVHGKVKSTTLPKDYQPAQYPLLPADPLRTDHDQETVVFTTIPTPSSRTPRDPDGYSQWIVLGPTKRKVLEAPGYPQPVPKPPGAPAYVLRSTPKMGMGLFATRNIKYGELIFAERPLLVTPRNLSLLGQLVFPKDCDESTFQIIATVEYEKQLEMAVARMTPENQAAYKSLLNNYKYGCGPLFGVMRTNSYGIDELFDGPELLPSDANIYAAVSKTGSRINHSCMTNIILGFSLSSFSLQFYATLDIKAGEQLFYSYCAENQSVADRQKELSGYGFVCDCAVCANATPETDRFREQYRQRAKEYCQKIDQWNSFTRKVAESVIDPILKFREALIKEGLHATSDYRHLVTRIMQFYSKQGLHEKANAYLEEVKKYIDASDATLNIIIS